MSSTETRNCCQLSPVETWLSLFGTRTPMTRVEVVTSAGPWPGSSRTTTTLKLSSGIETPLPMVWLLPVKTPPETMKSSWPLAARSRQ
jgi:hypothetical protein